MKPLFRVLLVIAATASVGGQSRIDTITQANLLAGLESADRWVTFSGDYTGQRHSPLAQITPSNVAGLEEQWTFDFPPPSFDPVRGLFFVTARETCAVYAPGAPAAPPPDRVTMTMGRGPQRVSGIDSYLEPGRLPARASRARNLRILSLPILLNLPIYRNDGVRGDGLSRRRAAVLRFHWQQIPSGRYVLQRNAASVSEGLPRCRAGLAVLQ